jgi:hypothetical protein
LLFSGINKEYIDAFNELKKAEIIVHKNRDPFIAYSEGDIYKLPFPKNIKVYKLQR